MGPTSTLRTVLAATGAVLRRPGLWLAALRQLRRFAPRRWWRRPPFLPWPHAGLAAFRAETMYGDKAAVPTASDVITWLEWCRAQPTTRPARSLRLSKAPAEH